MSNLDEDAKRHEQAARDLIARLEGVLTEGLNLTENAQPQLFAKLRDFYPAVRRLFEENSYIARRRAERDLKNQIEELLKHRG